MIPLLLLVLMPAAAFGQAEWQMLFDGQKTPGLSTMNEGGFPAKSWRVHEGVLEAVPGSAWKDLVTDASYGDFELEWEWKLAAGANSGVKYKVQAQVPQPETLIHRGMVVRGAAMWTALLVLMLALLATRKVAKWPHRARVAYWIGLALVGFMTGSTYWGLHLLNVMSESQAVGPEYQMIDDSTQRDASAKSGGLYELFAPAGLFAKAPGEWNESRLVVRGAMVEHWLNGQPALRYQLGSAAFRSAVSRSKFRVIQGYAEAARAPVAFQHHGGGCEFRVIRIRELPRSLPGS
jgi:hypothetical protein